MQEERQRGRSGGGKGLGPGGSGNGSGSGGIGGHGGIRVCTKSGCSGYTDVEENGMNALGGSYGDEPFYDILTPENASFTSVLADHKSAGNNSPQLPERNIPASETAMTVPGELRMAAGDYQPVTTAQLKAADPAASLPKAVQQNETILWKTEEERQAEQSYDEKGAFSPVSPEADIETSAAKFLDLREAGWNEFRAWQDGARNMEAVSGDRLSIEQASMRLTDLMPSRESGRNFAELSEFAANNQQGMMDGTRSFSADATLVYRSSLSA
ncbi:hypothetical protein EDF68_1326 [Ochrobactrum sp. BH3]|nr:hypothetical protein EDF68_1326 [Ochrobactrum sp. BH3]